jgi:hypothetical protein
VREELDLFTPADPMRFDGSTYDATQDESRLAAQHRRVADVMKSGQWMTLDEIAAVTGDPPASVSARLRDFRKERFGGYQVDRRRRDRGLYEYRIGDRKSQAA